MEHLSKLVFIGVDTTTHQAGEWYLKINTNGQIVKSLTVEQPIASATVSGISRLFSNTVQTVASNAVTATASRTYGLQLNSTGQLVVNVPWVNTTYTLASLGAEPAFSKGSLVQGDAITLTGTLANRLVGTGNITIEHADTSTQASISNSNGIIIQSASVDTYGHITSLGSMNGDVRWLRNVEVLNSQSTWSHIPLTSGIDLTSYTTGSNGYPSTLGYAVAFYANTSDSTSGYGRTFALNRAYNTEDYYIGSPDTNGVHNGWRKIWHEGNFIPANYAASTHTHIHNNTTEKQGGDGTNFYHLGEVQYNTLLFNTRTITINGITQDLSENRNWVTSSSSYQRDKFIFSSSNSFTLTRNTPTAIQVFKNGQKKEFIDDWAIIGNIVTLNTTNNILVAGDEISIEYFYSTADIVPNNINGSGVANRLVKWNTSTQLGISLIEEGSDLISILGKLNIQTVNNGAGNVLTFANNEVKQRTYAELVTDLNIQTQIETGSLVAGTGVLFEGSETDRLFGAGDLTINVSRNIDGGSFGATYLESQSIDGGVLGS